MVAILGQTQSEDRNGDEAVGMHCVCYVTDTNYLFPTVLSALQARSHLPQGHSDVIVFANDVDPNALAAFTRLCAEKGLMLAEIPSDIAQIFNQLQKKDPQFNKRITVSCMGRLLLADILPTKYKEFLYLDGDTQVVSDLAPLLHFPVPPGKFMAARDYTTIMRPFNKHSSTSAQAHHDRLGLSVEQSANYFNSGVIRANRESWAKIGSNALRYYLEHPDRCEPFHDMGALNGSACENLIVISNRWNFPRQFMHVDLGDHPKPVIYHYMANPKPWHGTFLPWGRKEFAPYAELARAYPEVSVYMPRLTTTRWAGYKLKTCKSYIANRISKPTSADIVAELYDHPFPI